MRLPGFIAELNSKHDPTRDCVILGNCVSFSPGTGFLQGGSGWLLSRRAAELIAPLRDEFARQIDAADDVCFNWILDRIGISLQSATSGAFIGHDIHAAFGGGLPACEEEEEGNDACATFTAPLRGVVFWHEQLTENVRLAATIERARQAFASPPNVHFWMDGQFVRLCRTGRRPR